MTSGGAEGSGAWRPPGLHYSGLLLEESLSGLRLALCHPGAPCPTRHLSLMPSIRLWSSRPGTASRQDPAHPKAHLCLRAPLALTQPLPRDTAQVLQRKAAQLSPRRCGPGAQPGRTGALLRLTHVSPG